MTHLELLDPTAALWRYRREGEVLLVEGRQPPDERGRWREADAEHPLYLRLADLTRVGDDGTVALAEGWRERALDFANLYAPPVPTRRLALARTLSLSWFAREALVLRWAMELQTGLGAGARGGRDRAIAAAMQVHALLPEVPEESVSVHPPEPRGEQQVDPAATLSVAPLTPEQVRRRVRELTSRHGQPGLWLIATNVLASVVNWRLHGIAPICLPGVSKSGAPQLGLGFTFPSPAARIWFGFWQALGGVRVMECARCERPFIATRPGQRFCSKTCQVAAGVERHRARRREEEL